MACLYNQVIHINKAITLTHAHSQTKKNLLPDQLNLGTCESLAQLELPGQRKPDQGEESGTQSSSCSPSSTEAEGVPGVGEVVNSSLFL